MNKRLMLVVLALVMVGSITGMAATRHIITPDVAKLFDGTLWQYSFYVADLGSATATNEYLLKTPATGEYHLSWEIYASAGVYMYIYENPTINATQTESTTYCKNRVKDTATTVKVWADGYFTLGSTGSKLIREVMVAGGNKAGGTGSANTGWILAADEEYYILLTAIVDNPAYSLTLQWHSHE